MTIIRKRIAKYSNRCLGMGNFNKGINLDLDGGRVPFQMPSYDFDAMMNDEACLFNSLYDLYQWGFVLLNNAPKQDGVLMDMAARIGWVRSTQFG